MVIGSFVRRGALLGVGAMLVASGLAAGCSRDYDSRTIPAEEGGPPKEGGDFDSGPTTTCPSSVPVDRSKLDWKPPTPPQAGKCQDDDVEAMKQFLVDEPNATNEEFQAFVKNRDATCHDCVFGDGLAATWPPAPVKDGKVATFNVGACYAVLTGVDACGQAIQNEWDCEFEACASCTSSEELVTCRTASRTSACKTFLEESQTKCGTAPSVDDLCGGPFDSIRVQCVTSSRDASTD